MNPFYQEDGITILQGDCREILSALPDQSVNCCVTSPPYWGLRDYGTAKWEGGDSECDHRQGRPGAGRVDGIVDERMQRNRDGAGAMGGDCRKCGARRIDNQIGLEPTPEGYVSRIVEVFRELRRVLRNDGTLWLILGDSYATGGGRVGDAPGGGKQGEAWRIRGLMTTPNRMPLEGLKPKDLIGIPWRVAFALQADGWYLRSDIIWHKPNPMPESVTDRPTKAHEYLFLLSKSERYYYDAEAIAEQGSGRNWLATGGNLVGAGLHKCGDGYRDNEVGRDSERYGRNKRSVWTVATEPYPEAHFATFPTSLIEPCIKAGCPAGGTVFDPFGGSGTTMQVARALGCRGLMIELNRDYCRLAAKRLRQAVLPLVAAQ